MPNNLEIPVRDDRESNLLIQTIMPGKILIILLTGALLASCASTNLTGGPVDYIPLRQPARTQIRSTSVYLGQNPANNNNVFTASMGAPTQTGGGQVGLLGALIGTMIAGAIVNENVNERQQTQHAKMAIHEALIKYNYASKFRAKLQQKITAQQWLHVQDIQKEPRFLSGDYSSLAAQVNTDAILIFDTYYKMTPDLKTFVLVANVVLYPVSKHLKSYVHDKNSNNPALFHNRYTIEFSEHATKHIPGYWTQKGRLKKALDTGIPALIKVAIEDLNDNLSQTAAGMPKLHNVKGDLKITQLKSGEYKLVDDMAAM